ncbi:hypothetical protein, partial [Lawsonibacter hominis]|uniref:hypothetical protein n=1 Tax=Lawsonibacter hominis TaxID=2763053 RepID=UPI00333407CC
PLPHIKRVPHAFQTYGHCFAALQRARWAGAFPRNPQRGSGICKTAQRPQGGFSAGAAANR